MRFNKTHKAKGSNQDEWWININNNRNYKYLRRNGDWHTSIAQSYYN